MFTTYFVYIQLIYTCIDIDECNDFNEGCAQTCTNVNGSYTCSCSTGYVLSNDAHNCTGIITYTVKYMVCIFIIRYK